MLFRSVPKKEVQNYGIVVADAVAAVDYPDLARMGSDNPVAATWIKNAVQRGTKLVMLDPRRSELSRMLGLSDDELAKILAVASREHQLMIRLAVGTMLRWSEQVALRRDWIIRRPYPKLLLPSSKRKNKTGEAEEVPLFPGTLAVLEDLMALHDSVFVQRVRGKNPCNFPNRIGRRAGVTWQWRREDLSVDFPASGGWALK